MSDEHVLVIGGGISGIASALALANYGFNVYLIEKEATFGGHAASFCCKATDVCSKCSVCVASQKIKEALVHPQILLLTNSTVQKIGGGVGNFRVEVTQKPQYIDAGRCIACGLCAEACPTEPKAVYLPSAEATPFSYVLDERLCVRFKGEDCNLCRESCPTKAIDFDPEPKRQELSAGAIIVATGFDVFDARKKGGLGYGRYPNVLTGLDLERMFNNEGSIKLPSNGKEPHNIAFIQCVGSRDEYIGNGYCSQVCCKYAIRFARLLSHQNPKAEITIFYIDLQTAGKGFGEFYEECKKAIRFTQGIPVEICQTPSGELEVRYENISEGMVTRQNFDLVVLSVGIVPGKDSWEVARTLGINLGEHGFFGNSSPLESTETIVAGIFLAGTCQGPKDIPDSIAHGIQAASRAIQVLAVQRV